MIAQLENESRTRYLLRVAAEYIAKCPEHTIDYDDTTCDGACLAEELGIEAESIKMGDENENEIQIYEQELVLLRSIAEKSIALIRGRTDSVYSAICGGTGKLEDAHEAAVREYQAWVDWD